MLKQNDKIYTYGKNFLLISWKSFSLHLVNKYSSTSNFYSTNSWIHHFPQKKKKKNKKLSDIYISFTIITENWILGELA